MFRLTATVALLCLSCLLLACGRKKDQAVTISPDRVQKDAHAVPADPFGSSSPAYERLREVTDAALATPWSGKLEEFGPWLEEQTVAVERSLNLLKAIRVGPVDIYSVANARIAMVYEQIATALTEATTLAEGAGYEADWKGQEDLIWQQANGFWARCVRGAGMAGPHLDGWDLRCRTGLSESARQPK